MKKINMNYKFVLLTAAMSAIPVSAQAKVPAWAVKAAYDAKGWLSGVPARLGISGAGLAGSNATYCNTTAPILASIASCEKSLTYFVDKVTGAGPDGKADTPNPKFMLSTNKDVLRWNKSLNETSSMTCVSQKAVLLECIGKVSNIIEVERAAPAKPAALNPASAPAEGSPKGEKAEDEEAEPKE